MIRRRRLERGWRLEDLRQILTAYGHSGGTSISRLSQIERGDLRPDEGLLEAVAAVLGLPELVWAERSSNEPGRSDLVRVQAHLIAGSFSPPLDVSLGSRGVPTDLGVLKSRRLCKEGDGDFADFFPFGALVVHECHELAATNWDELAGWRRRHVDDAGTDLAAHWQGRIGQSAASLIDPVVATFFVVEPRRGVAPSEDLAVALIDDPVTGSPLRTHAGRPHDGVPLLSEQVTEGERRCTFGLLPHHVGWSTRSVAALCDFSPGSAHAGQLLDLELQLLALRCLGREVRRGGRTGPAAVTTELLKRSILQLSRPRSNTRRAASVLRDAVIRSSGLSDLVRAAVPVG